MRRRTFLKVAAGSAAALCAAGTAHLAAPRLVHAGGSSQTDRTRVLLSEPTPAAGQPLTLQQAWQLSLRQGRAWSADAAIAGLRSLDQSSAGVSTEQANAGADGRRAVWEATLVSPSKPSSQLRVRIVDGAPVQSVAEPRTLRQPPLTRPPALDSPDAVAAARAALPQLAPGGGKGRGYAFTLGPDEGGQAALVVLGSIRGMPAKVDFDAASGRKIGASVYGFSDGGILYSADAGQTWRASNLAGQQVQKIAAAANQVDVAYAVGLTMQSVPISKTSDGGRTWHQAGALPGAAGLRVSDLAVAAAGDGRPTLAAGAPSGLWLSRDGGSSWQRDASLPSGAVQWVVAITTASGSILLATIASLSSPEHAGVYASTNGGAWRRLLPTSCRLSVVDDGRAAVALADDGSPTAHLIAGTTAAPLTLPIRALRAAGTVAPGSPLLVGSALALAVSSDAGRSWTTTLRQNTTSIAVAPTAGDVALAGGFRTGIFRSSDGGHTWRRVLSDASAILPGSDELGSLTFLSPSHVVAVQGAVQTWQPV